jgi:sodium transport system permease protein
VMFFAGMMLALSAHAKNMREAQSFLGVANFVVLTPAVFSQLIGFTDLAQSMAVKFTPVLNTALLIRDALLGKFDPLLFAGTLVTNLVLAGIGFSLAVWMFKREQILARM